MLEIRSCVLFTPLRIFVGGSVVTLKTNPTSRFWFLTLRTVTQVSVYHTNYKLWFGAIVYTKAFYWKINSSVEECKANVKLWMNPKGKQFAWEMRVSSWELKKFTFKLGWTRIPDVMPTKLREPRSWNLDKDSEQVKNVYFKNTFLEPFSSLSSSLSVSGLWRHYPGSWRPMTKDRNLGT